MFAVGNRRFVRKDNRGRFIVMRIVKVSRVLCHYHAGLVFYYLSICAVTHCQLSCYVRSYLYWVDKRDAKSMDF